MKGSEGRRVAVAAAVAGAAFGAVAIAFKLQRDAEASEWAGKVREAVSRADELKDLKSLATATAEGQAVLTRAEAAHFSAVGLQDAAVRSVRGWRDRFVDTPGDSSVANNFAKALAAVSHQGQSGVNYANAIVDELGSRIANRKLYRPPHGLS